MRELVAEGLRNPRRILPFLVSKIAPRSSWALGDGVRYEDGALQFSEGAYAASAGGRDEFAAKIHREVGALREMLDGRSFDAALEAGCGYGRLTPWLSEFADEVYGVDVNDEATTAAMRQYNDIEFVRARCDDLPLSDSSVDLIVTWTCLHHIPPEQIGDSLAELSRVAASDATFVLAESVSEQDGPTVWGRAPEEYASRLGFRFVRSRPKPVERTYNDGEHPRDRIMVFRGANENP
jgi:SAM-dependent methyltransferase